MYRDYNKRIKRMENLSELKKTDPSLATLLQDEVKLDEELEKQPDNVEVPNTIPANTLRRTEQPKDDLSQKTREALEEGNRRSERRQAEQQQAARERANEDILLKQEAELKNQFSTTLSSSPA